MDINGLKMLKNHMGTAVFRENCWKDSFLRKWKSEKSAFKLFHLL
jgi:hypothetical protein